jgi:hypothetical protein
MSQSSRRARVRQLADSVWPGRTVNGYANLIAARLRKLADEGSTGMLPVSGPGDGAIFFRGGQVVYAESSRTPLPATRATDLAALTELLSSESRFAKFRQAEAFPVGQGRPLAVETLLAEVQRRHEILRQLGPVVTPDTTVTCELWPGLTSAQVLPAQWALLVRAGEPATPRGLALQLGRSVFGTTIEVYRLLELGLLVVPGRPPAPAGGQAAAMSFIRAVSGGKGSDA